MFEWFKPVSILEQIAYQYFPTSWYQAMGQYFWPSLLIKKTPTICDHLGFETLEEACHWVRELDPKIAFAATAGVAIIAGGVYYWLAHRQGKVEAHPMITQETKKTESVSKESKKNAKKEEISSATPLPDNYADENVEVLQEIIQVNPLQEHNGEALHTLATLMKQTVALPARKKADEVVAKPQPKVGPTMMPLDTICRTYLNKYRGTDQAANNYCVHYGDQKHNAQQYVLKKMGLHLDGTVPTEPSEIKHYNTELDKLGLITHKL